MTDRSGNSIKALLVAVIVSNVVLTSVVALTCGRVERALRSSNQTERTAQSAEPRGQPPLPAATPVTAEQFRVQWEAHYGEIAEARCWRPHFGRYAELPGHLDLELQVSPEGLAQHVELVGYRNPDDSPDAGLVQALFECVAELLRPVHFPAYSAGYVVRGRVTRPNPPRKATPHP